MKNLEWAQAQDLSVLDEEDLFDDYLDEAFGDVKVAGYEYPTSRALKELDPTAYRCGMADYIDSLVSEGAIYQLDDGTLLADDPESHEGS